MLLSLHTIREETLYVNTNTITYMERYEGGRTKIHFCTDSVARTITVKEALDEIKTQWKLNE